MIPRFKPYIGLREFIRLIVPARKKSIEQFEQKFASQMNQKFAIAFPYGRTALMAVLQCLSIKDAEVICPAYTCVVVPHAIVNSGNEPIFIDSTHNEFNMDLSQVAKAINEKTKAVIVTSLFGYPVNLDDLTTLRDRYPHLEIIQDCAHSFAAEYQGQAVQTFGKAAIYGLNVSKLISSIFGGMVTTDDPYLAKALKRYQTENLKPYTLGHSLKRRLYAFCAFISFLPLIYKLTEYLGNLGILNYFIRYYQPDTIEMPKDFNISLTPLEAEIGLVQLSKYQEIIRRRVELAQYYNGELKDISGLDLPNIVTGATYSHYVPMLQKKYELIDFARNKGVQIGELIEYSIPSLPAYLKRQGNRYTYENSEKYAKTTINLPMNCSLKQAKKVVDVIRDYHTR